MKTLAEEMRRIADKANDMLNEDNSDDWTTRYPTLQKGTKFEYDGMEYTIYNGSLRNQEIVAVDRNNKMVPFAAKMIADILNSGSSATRDDIFSEDNSEGHNVPFRFQDVNANEYLIDGDNGEYFIKRFASQFASKKIIIKGNWKKVFAEYKKIIGPKGNTGWMSTG